ncbi:MAG TPA: hypothetical protein VL463_05075 [Kofleriaceae bacterium]|jgi:hypothetical protein|nr:hypothetical protein [Kofleriaceae bacterium]
MSKNTVRALVLLLLIVLVIWWYRSRRAAAPDERLASHLSAICDIAEADVSSPSQGVTHLFTYLADNSPAMLSDLGETLVLIEGIRSDEDHDARARLAASRLQDPLIGCADTLQRFGDAIQRDPDARAKFQQGVTRFSRTLEILLGASGRTLVPADLGRVGFVSHP